MTLGSKASRHETCSVERPCQHTTPRIEQITRMEGRSYSPQPRGVLRVGCGITIDRLASLFRVLA
jgi:hypothetical protein